MAMDEALLEHAGGRRLLRRFHWAGSPPFGTTFGYFVPAAEAEAAARARFGARSLPLVRRPTGGGVVFHDGDLTFSFVFPWPRPLTAARVYQRIHEGVQAGLRGAGARTALWRGASPGTASLCFSRCEPLDLAREDGGKALGGALRKRRGAGLYQGSLRPEGLGLPLERLWRAVAEGLSLQWREVFAPGGPGPEAEAEARRLDRRYRSNDWNRKR